MHCNLILLTTLYELTCGGTSNTIVVFFNLKKGVMVFNATFNNIFIDGGNRNTKRKPPTCRKSLTNFIILFIVLAFCVVI
jgi:hypothetical protein